MGFSAGRNIDFAIPALQNTDCEMGRGAEAEESDALTFFDTRHAERAEADDTGTEQRRGMEIVELRRNRKTKVGAGERVFRIASIHGVARKGGEVAQVFHIAAAVSAGAVGS